jgi:hypothetical protein
MSSVVCRGGTPFTADEKAFPVRVQWDPERSPRLGMLGYRSIQIGVGRAMSMFLPSSFVVVTFNGRGVGADVRVYR